MGAEHMREPIEVVLALSEENALEVAEFIQKKYSAISVMSVSDFSELQVVASGHRGFVLFMSPDFSAKIYDAKQIAALRAHGARHIIAVCEERHIRNTQNYRIDLFDDYIFTSPCFFAELEKLVLRCCYGVEYSREDRFVEQHRACARALFVRNIIYDHGYTDTLEHINQKFCVNLREGCYRTIMIHPDIEGRAPHFEILELLNEHVLRLSERLLKCYCYDAIYQYRFSGFLIYINYPRENDDIIKERCKALLEILSGIMADHKKYTFTVALSRIYDSWMGFESAKHEAYHTSYRRLDEGSNSVIIASDGSSNWDGDMQACYEQSIKTIMTDCENLDYKSFAYHLRALLAFLRNRTSQARLFQVLVELSDSFFNMHTETLSGEIECDAARNSIAWSIYSSKDASSMTEAVLIQMKTLFDLAKSKLENTARKPIRLATAYINEHLDDQISLSDVAGRLFLSPGYFAQLFKKETGKSFTEYVADCKKEQAKEMLKLTNLSIQEISLRVGFSDQRYFSRWFKSHVGITPSEYRQTHWKR